MDKPKISVLIPMYNRKHYISQCVDSALNQTFQEDYEIIIRDNCSTDGGFEFVAEKYAKEISAGKIKLIRNPANIGQWLSVSRLMTDATGKYIMVLHSDDMYLSHALQHLYEVAEKTNADVVHSSFFFTSPPTGTINDVKNFKPICYDRTYFDKVTVMPASPIERFIEWANYGSFVDIQYNIFNRKFAVDNLVNNGVFLEGFYDCPGLQNFCWLMTAKIFVKTPIIFYICREAPDSISRSPLVKSNFSIEDFIGAKIKMCRYFDYLLPKIDFFKENKIARDFVKMKFVLDSNNYQLGIHNQIYKNGFSDETYKKIENAFKTYFGADYFFPMIFYQYTNNAFLAKNNILNSMLQNIIKSAKKIVNPPCPPPSRVGVAT